MAKKQNNKNKTRIYESWSKPKRLLFVVAIIVLVGVCLLFIYKYTDARNELNKAKDPQQSTQETANNLAAEIGKHIELPTDESPTLATVNDASKLKSQIFFAKAENGDQVLIYAQAKKAVIYRPSTKKVIEYASISLGEQAP